MFNRALTMRNAFQFALTMRNMSMRNADAARGADYAQRGELQHQILLRGDRKKHGKLSHLTPVRPPVQPVRLVSQIWRLVRIGVRVVAALKHRPWMRTTPTP